MSTLIFYSIFFINYDFLISNSSSRTMFVSLTEDVL